MAHQHLFVLGVISPKPSIIDVSPSGRDMVQAQSWPGVLGQCSPACPPASAVPEEKSCK